MPIFVPRGLPAIEQLKKENILISEYDNLKNSILPTINIAIFNLMPKKIDTERQFLKQLHSNNFNIKVDLLTVFSHDSKNTPRSHIDKFYKFFHQVKDKFYDGMIITGAPVEDLSFEQVDYWDEMTKIFDYARTNVKSTMYICWAALASLYYFYNIQKHPVNSKIFGIFEHRLIVKNKLVQNFDETFYLPHSRHMTLLKDELIAKKNDLFLISDNLATGPAIIYGKNHNEIYNLGHFEYEKDTLAQEYYRDLSKNMDIHIPINYFIDDNPKNDIEVKWKKYSKLFFNNWLNYYCN